MITLLITSIYLIIGLILIMAVVLSGIAGDVERYERLVEDINEGGTLALVIYTAIFASAAIVWPILLSVVLIDRIRN